VDADTVHLVAGKIGNTAMARYYEKSIGVIGHGEFHIVIINVPGRTYIFPILNGLKHQ